MEDRDTRQVACATPGHLRFNPTQKPIGTQLCYTLTHPSYHPIWDQRFIKTMDASYDGIGAILSQIIDGKENFVYYSSRTLSKAERNYSDTHLEGLGVIYGVKKFQNYVWGRNFKIVTDHSGLIKLIDSKETSGRLARWDMILKEFDYEIVHRKGSKNPADLLSRAPKKPLMINENNEYGSETTDNEKALFSMDFLRYNALKNYILNKEYPVGADENFIEKLQNHSKKYRLINGNLYSYRIKDRLKEVLTQKSAQEIIRLIHEQDHTGIYNT
ncbi:Retrovirus-related Pol polyprotein from transposon [Smittium culicis]|uniref:Retrovirus-related Pol polyprotein from transposon n=1 Tax=Smittium culicis TaxID=133412 RepID=A0A1R1XR33_9FUNG|nr:Retrovirus-related Pol polyprotein from transposon [Smittium culicis]